MARLHDRPAAIPSADGYRCAQVVRILRLMQMIERRTYLPPLDHLARHLQVSTRTIRRDLDVLRAVGVRVPSSAPSDGGAPVALPPPHYTLDLDEPATFRLTENGGAR